MIRVGITGHRPNRMHIGVARVEARLVQVLKALRKGRKSDAKLVAISALAEGSDRLFASAALTIGYELVALLPFKSSDYETTFGDTSANPEYHALLARAGEVVELQASLTDSTAGYEAVGRLTVDRCDVLVAVWDGKPAAGRGGTPEIIQYALEQRHPVIWIDATNDRPARRLIAMLPDPLAKPIGPVGYKKLLFATCD
jgi:hypothetical protein